MVASGGTTLSSHQVVPDGLTAAYISYSKADLQALMLLTKVNRVDHDNGIRLGFDYDAVDELHCLMD